MEKRLPESKIQDHVKKVVSKIVPRLTTFLQEGEQGEISFKIHASQSGVSDCKYKIEGKM